jgi:hypothetical protein
MAFPAPAAAGAVPATATGEPPAIEPPQRGLRLATPEPQPGEPPEPPDPAGGGRPALKRIK